jgi:glycosyltransferase involved in cell wall biosynthesis
MNTATNTRLKLNHLMLEPYQARYTEFLHQWENRAFGKYFNVNPISPAQQQVALQIGTGEVLDAVNRPVWAMNQVAELMKQAPTLGHIWFSDFFHPGLEALPYSRSHFRAFSFLWAQSFDRYDFTTKFMSWMRPWEIMALDIYEKIFVACEFLKELIVTAVPHVEEKISVVGLPFNHRAVQGRLGNVPQMREFDLVYSSRFDTEKDPGFFLDVVEGNPSIRAVICTGHPELRGTDSTQVRRAKDLRNIGRLTIKENCSKEDYYHVLASSKVQFNCAKQDWVSFTLLEALTFGCMPLYPAFRAFPDTLYHHPNHLYIPNDLRSAAEKLIALLDNPPPEKEFNDYRITILEEHSGTLDRIGREIAEV